MATQVGEAVIKLSFDGKSVTSSLSKVESEAEGSSGKILGKLKTLGKTAGVVAAGITVAGIKAIGTITKTAIEGFAQYEQLVGGVDTLFKDASDTVQKYAMESFKTAQISANEYMDTVTSFSASLIQSLGGDTQKAAEYANQAIIDMSDNANKMGTSMEMIQNAYQGFAKQNYTMLDNLKLGYGGTRGEMKRLLEDAEKISGVHYELGNFADMTQAIHVIQEELGIAGTSAQEASHTIQGSLNAMRSAWKNLIVGVADDQQDFGKLMDDFVSSAGTFLENIIPRIKETLPRVAQLIKEITPLIIELLPELITELTPALIDASVQIALALVNNLPNLVTMLIPPLINAVFQIFTALILKIPELMLSLLNAIVQSIPAVVSGLVSGFINQFSQLSAIGDALLGFFNGVWESLVNGASAVWENIMNIFGSVAEFFGNIFGSAWEAVKNVFSTGGKIFMGIVDGITEAFRNIVNAIIGGINHVVAIPFNAINGFLSFLKGIDILGIKPFDWVGTIDVPQIPMLAEGGFVNGTTGAIIGEEGAEVVLPLESNTGNWAGLLATTLAEEMSLQGNSGTVNVYMDNKINNKLDAEEIGQIMIQSIRRAV